MDHAITRRALGSHLQVDNERGQYHAGRCMDFDEATPENVAAAIEGLRAQPGDYLEVETGTAARAAKRIAELL